MHRKVAPFALALVALAPVARADITIHPVAGRGIGDGRLATAASLDSPVGVAFAADGALLIADRDHHRIRRVDPTTGVITTYAGTLEGEIGTGPPDEVQLKRPVRVFLTASGDILIPEQATNRIRRIHTASGAVDVFAGNGTAGAGGDNGPAALAMLNQPNDVAEDSAGNIYIADFMNHRIRKVTPGGVISTFAGTGIPGALGDNGPAVAAQLQFPACVLVGPGDVVYICDKANNRIRRVQGGVITTVAGSGVAGFSGDGPATAAALNEPEDAAFDATGRIVFSDQGNNRVRVLDLAAGTVTTIAGTGVAGYGGEGVPATAASIAAPAGVAVAADGRVIFGERDADRVRAIDNANLVTIAGDGVSEFGGDGEPALNATFFKVEGVAEDAAGNIYVSDSGNNRIRKIDLATDLTSTIAGNGTTDFGVDEVPAVVVGLSSPSDVVVDGAGNVLISDSMHDRVRSVDPGGTIHTIVGTGVAGFSGDTGPATAAQIDFPTGLQFDAAGNLYVTDWGNNRIRKVDPAGIITTVAGNGDQSFNSDGLAATATALNRPTDVAFDAAGNMYIADTDNQRVRKVDAATGIVTTIAGTGVVGDSPDFIPAITAALDFPTDVAIDPSGNVLIADSRGNRIRRVSPNGVIDTVIGTGAPGDAGDNGPPIAAKLLTPLRINFMADGRLFIVDRDNSRIRAVGQPPPSTTTTTTLPSGIPPPGGTPNNICSNNPGTCVPGGGPKKTDCFMEFALDGAHVAGVTKATCRDGDATCDRDQTPGQCTIRVRACFGGSDRRISQCQASPVRNVKLLKPKAEASVFMTAVSSLQGAHAVAGRKPAVSFDTPTSGCSGAMDVVVRRHGSRSGKMTLQAVAAAGSGKDIDRLVLICTPGS